MQKGHRGGRTAATVQDRSLRSALRAAWNASHCAGPTSRRSHIVQRKSGSTPLAADHLLFRFPQVHQQGAWDAWSLLAALAATTQTIEIGPLVACTSFRNPTLIAKMAARSTRSGWGLRKLVQATSGPISMVCVVAATTPRATTRPRRPAGALGGSGGNPGQPKRVDSDFLRTMCNRRNVGPAQRTRVPAAARSAGRSDRS